MKTICWLLAGAIVLGASWTAPASAANDQPATQKAARHKPHVKRIGDVPRSVREADPHFIGDLTGSCKLQRDAGACMIDLGYGRCESCNGGGPQ